MNNKATELLKNINTVLEQHKIDIRIHPDDISICNKIIYDGMIPGSPLSNAIINKIWPSINHKVVYHYTTKEAAENILNTNTFRLYSILKRFHEHEIKTFCENHGLDGYLKQDKWGEAKYKDLIMPNIFYSSFTDVNTYANLWKAFADNNGVRLKIEIDATSTDFRKVIYEDSKGKQIKLFEDLNNIFKKDDLKLVINGISRISAFYLPKNYNIENEYRILYRYWKESNNLIPIKDKTYDYVEIPLNTRNDSGFHLKIIEIMTNEKLNIPSKYSVTNRNYT